MADHASLSPTVADAANWLADHDEGAFSRPVTAELRERFGLAFNDACKAVAEARRLRAAAEREEVTKLLLTDRPGSKRR